MALNNEFMESVLADVRKYNGIRQPVKAGMFERLFTKKLPVSKLHPNPDDEFSMEKIGPNFEIINEYCQKIDLAIRMELQIFEEPLLVEKMNPEGYMLINGHHRWAAAVMRKIPSIHVKIINLTHMDYINDALDRSNNNKRITLDFDEVITVDKNSQYSEKMSILIKGLSKFGMRLGIPKLISTLQSKGYDVWIYASGLYSSDDLEKFFEVYNVKVDGIINGIGTNFTKKIVEDETIKEKVANKYILTVNADSKSVYYSANKGQEYDLFDVTSDDENWSENVLSIIENIEKQTEQK